MPWTVIKQYIKCKAIKLNTYVWWELGVLWGNRQNGVNQQRILRKKKKNRKKKTKINYNKKDSLLRFIFSPQHGNCPPSQAPSSQEGALLGGGSSLWVRFVWRKAVDCTPVLVLLLNKVAPMPPLFFIFEFANDWKLGNQGQTGLGQL